MNIHFSASQSEFLLGFLSWHRCPFPNLNHWLKLKHSITVEEPTKIISFQFLILGFFGWSWLPRKLFLISLFKTSIAIIQIWYILPNIWTNDFFPLLPLLFLLLNPSEVLYGWVWSCGTPKMLMNYQQSDWD